MLSYLNAALHQVDFSCGHFEFARTAVEVVYLLSIHGNTAGPYGDSAFHGGHLIELSCPCISSRLEAVMLALTVARSTALLCRPAQLSLGGCGRASLGRAVVRDAGWRRLASGEARAVRAIPVETGGVRAKLSGESWAVSIPSLFFPPPHPMCVCLVVACMYFLVLIIFLVYYIIVCICSSCTVSNFTVVFSTITVPFPR